ncbi:hypothetical protein ACS0TY_030517 [Phlomoides rotata]
MSSPDESETEVLDLGEVEGSIQENRISFCLAGKLFTERSYNTFALMDVMLKAFKSRTKVAAREWGNKLLIFTFSDEKDRDWVIRNQPWHFDGHLFVVRALDGSEQPSSVILSKASFWTRAYDLPIMCQTEATLRSIAARIGALEVFEPPGELNVGSYLRFKVEIDVSKPLTRGLKVRVKGEEQWIPIKYESLPFYCFCCGKVGHNFKACDLYDRNECPDPVDMDYGPFLKASPMKKGRGVKVENVSIEKEAGKRGESPAMKQISANTRVLGHLPDRTKNKAPEASQPSLPPPSTTILPNPHQKFQDTALQTTPNFSHSQPSKKPALPEKTRSETIKTVSHHTNPDTNQKPTYEPSSIQNQAAVSSFETSGQEEGAVISSPNPRRTTWKRNARAKGKEVSSSNGDVQLSCGEKRGAENLGDLMDIDCLASLPKKGKSGLEDSDGGDGGSGDLILSAVEVSGLHCRDL